MTQPANQTESSNGQLQLERQAYNDFCALWADGEFPHLRYGQAFYNHFNLHKLNNQDQLLNLYEKDGDAAKKVINQVFCFN